MPLVHRATAGTPVATPCAEGDEGGAALVVVHLHVDAVVGRQRQGERRRAAPGRDHGEADPGERPLVHEGGAERRLRGHAANRRVLGLMALHTVVAGSGPRIVLVHGFAQTQACWGEVGDALASDHEVVRVDAPGHGGSADVRADLAGTADLLAEAGGPATYLGYSMGGRMVLHLALAHPEVVRGMVLVGATAGIDDPIEREARQVADDALAVAIEVDGMDAFLDRWLALPLFAGLDEHTAFRAERLANTTDGLASSLRLAGTGQQEPLWDRLGSIDRARARRRRRRRREVRRPRPTDRRRHRRQRHVRVGGGRRPLRPPRAARRLPRRPPPLARPPRL